MSEWRKYSLRAVHEQTRKSEHGVMEINKHVNRPLGQRGGQIRNRKGERKNPDKQIGKSAQTTGRRKRACVLLAWVNLR